VSDYGLDDREIEVRSLAEAKDFSSSLCVQTNTKGGRRRGRPRVTWRSTVRMEAEYQGKSWPEIKALSKNRIRW
jgi:hypothetical protein